MKYLIMLLLLVTIQNPINIEGQAQIKKISWQDGKIINEINYDGISKFSIHEEDSILIVGNEKYNISEIISTDSIVTYLCNDKPGKEYVYDYEYSLTQKNIKWRSYDLETWFVYTLIKSRNEFELGN